MPTDCSLFDWLLQVFLVGLESRPVIVARPGWAHKISGYISASRFRRTWSILVLMDVPHWRSRNSKGLVCVMIVTMNTRVMHWHRISWIAVLSAASSALLMRPYYCFFLFMLTRLLRSALRQLVGILLCNFVELPLKTLLSPVLALVIFIRAHLPFARIHTGMI